MRVCWNEAPKFDGSSVSSIGAEVCERESSDESRVIGVVTLKLVT